MIHYRFSSPVEAERATRQPLTFLSSSSSNNSNSGSNCTVMLAVTAMTAELARNLNFRMPSSSDIISSCSNCRVGNDSSSSSGGGSPSKCKSRSKGDIPDVTDESELYLRPMKRSKSICACVMEYVFSY